jgi:hypothetical protein
MANYTFKLTYLNASSDIGFNQFFQIELELFPKLKTLHSSTTYAQKMMNKYIVALFFVGLILVSGMFLTLLD